MSRPAMSRPRSGPVDRRARARGATPPGSRPSEHRRRLLLLLALTLLGLPALASCEGSPEALGPAPAAAGPRGVDPRLPEPAPEPADREVAGELVDAVVDRLDPYRATRDRTGFAGLRAELDDRRLHLAWQGAVPAAVAQIVEDPADGVEVVLLAAPYSERDLDEGVAALFRSARDPAGPLATHGVTVTGASVLSDGSGLAVDVTDRSTRWGTSERLAQIAALASSAAGVAVVGVGPTAERVLLTPRP